jgi:hypothetical protein
MNLKSGFSRSRTPILVRLSIALFFVSVVFQATGAYSQQVESLALDPACYVPILDSIGSKSVYAEDSLVFSVHGYHLLGWDVILYTSELPVGAEFQTVGPNDGKFAWKPELSQVGSHQITFYVSTVKEPIYTDSEVVVITVNSPPNRPPVIDWLEPATICEREILRYPVHAVDPDAEFPILSVGELPEGATFSNEGNGYGLLEWQPAVGQAGLYTITVYASDEEFTVSQSVDIEVITCDPVPPILDSVGPREVTWGDSLVIAVYGYHPWGEAVYLYTSSLPDGAEFQTTDPGEGRFSWRPGLSQVGVHEITFYVATVNEPVLVDSEVVTITVVQPPNRAPVIQSIGPRSVVEGKKLGFTVWAFDPDSTIPSISTGPLPGGATFEGSEYGYGSFQWTPDSTQIGVHFVMFYASDGELLDSELVEITVEEFVNTPPVLDSIGPQEVVENSNLYLTIRATDADGTVLELYTSELPEGAQFSSGYLNIGAFSWRPNNFQAGVYVVTFYASDGIDIDSEAVQITVIDAGNQTPVIFVPPGQQREMDEGETIQFQVLGVDPDSTYPSISAYLDGTDVLAANMDTATTFDSAQVLTVFTLTFSPDHTQGSKPVPTSYYVKFKACDSEDDTLCSVSPTVTFTVHDVIPNQRPQFLMVPEDTDIFEWQHYEAMVVVVDGNGDRVHLECIGLPSDAEFVDREDGTGILRFDPDFRYVDSVYDITIKATDLVDTIATEFRLRVLNLPLQVGQTAEGDDIQVDSSITLRFNEPIDASTIAGNVSVVSHKGDLPTISHRLDNGVSVLEIHPGFSYFNVLDTINVTIGTGLLDLSGHSMTAPFTVTYRTGTVVYPGDTDNNGTVNERDVLPIGVYLKRTGPDRGANTGTVWQMIPVQIHRGTLAWQPAAAVYADADGSGQVTQEDICAVADNFGEIAVLLDQSAGDDSANFEAAVRQLGGAALSSMYDALLQCPESSGKDELLERLEEVLDESSSDLPTSLVLHQNYPNPFNPTTTIRFSIPAAGHVRLVVTNIAGQRVATLMDVDRGPGTYEVVWNATDESGASVASGVYFYTLTIGEESRSGRMLLLK